MADFVGQRLDDSATLQGRYVKHTPVATSHFRNGKPIAANIAMRLQQNLSHAAEQSHRHLFCLVVGGTLSQVTGWSGLVDASDPGTGGLATISWSSAVSRHRGPYFAIEDRLSADSVPVARTINLEVEAKSGAGSSLTMYAAITAGIDPQPPYLGALVEQTWSPGTTLAVTTKALALPRPMGGATPMRCRSAALSGSAPGEAYVLPYYVWVGWRSTNAGDVVLTVSAYETR